MTGPFWILLGTLVALSVLICTLLSLKFWCRGPSLGSRHTKKLANQLNLWFGGFKLVVITGGNTGIGKETVRNLAGRGARVIILCRDLDKANGVLQELGPCEGTVEVQELDLSSVASIKARAHSLLTANMPIDILINNAGVMLTPEAKTVDGFELQFMTNHLGHFLLTFMLLPLLEKSARLGQDPRVIMVSSVAHAWGSMHWEDLNWNRTPYNSLQAYAQSKLANILHAKYLARRLKGSKISVFCLHPGIVDTNLMKHVETSLILRLMSPIGRWVIKTPKQGAETTLYCALEDSILNRSGSYFVDCREKTPHRKALVESDQERLWIESMNLLEPFRVTCLTHCSNTIEVAIPSRIPLQDQYETLERILHIYAYCEAKGIKYSDFKQTRFLIKRQFLQKAMLNQTRRPHPEPKIASDSCLNLPLEVNPERN
eukprot:maker-scaffold60_size442463-snap-gene-2.15 protein:Tk12076 transcript:maker-scaffold60_size442463-snap-gene-2.15-mRNA-1 annotation:"retinol dehydrogenase 13-like"